MTWLKHGSFSDRWPAFWTLVQPLFFETTLYVVNKALRELFWHDKIRINVEKRVGYKRHSISATATKNDTKKMPQEDPEERLMYRNTMCLLCWWTYCRSVLSCKRHETISAPGSWANLPVFFFLACLRRLVITSPFHSLRSYRLVPSPFFGTRLRRLNFNLAPPIACVVSLGAVFSIVTQRSTAESFRSLVSKWSLNPVTRGLVEHENFNIGIT